MAANDSGGRRGFPSIAAPSTWIVAIAGYFAARAGLFDALFDALLGGIG